MTNTIIAKLKADIERLTKERDDAEALIAEMNKTIETLKQAYERGGHMPSQVYNYPTYAGDSSILNDIPYITYTCTCGGGSSCSCHPEPS